MACHSCSATLGLLPRRAWAAPSPGLLDSVQLRALVRSPATGPNSAIFRRQSGRSALHTSAPRQKFSLKELIGRRIGRRIAQSLGAQRSSYYVYTATERLYKACAAQADYAIEPADRKAGTLRTTPDGEEIGVSKGGEWHGGASLFFYFPSRSWFL